MELTQSVDFAWVCCQSPLIYDNEYFYNILTGDLTWDPPQNIISIQAPDRAKNFYISLL